MRVADVLSEHEKSPNGSSCSCGQWQTFRIPGGPDVSRWAYANHLIEVLNVSGFAVVELPRGEVNPEAWANQVGGISVMRSLDIIWNLSVVRARTLAAAMLAAADVAEAES